MATTISEKLRIIHDFIQANNPHTPGSQGSNLAESLQKSAAAAVIGGIKSRDWGKYISRLDTAPDVPGTPAFTPQQLTRLIGEDEPFNETDWASVTLAYIAANSTCGITTTTDTRKNMTPLMIANLDA